ncbi:hypothetical protein [Peribacillus frigoritolerans]|uniref:hypothetical protein n=1 Tax=Peribacillus frigoritolerans TaxID=450367 RepID=UPI0031E1D4E8
MKIEGGLENISFIKVEVPDLLIQSNTFNSKGMVLSVFYTELIGAEGTRLLLRKLRLGEAPRLPAASAWSINQRSNRTSQSGGKWGSENVTYLSSKRSSRIICPKTTPSTP